MICTVCCTWMEVKRFGIRVLETDGPAQEPLNLWAADLYRCPACGLEIIGSMGQSPMAEAPFSDDIRCYVEDLQEQGRLYFVHNK